MCVCGGRKGVPYRGGGRIPEAAAGAVECEYRNSRKHMEILVASPASRFRNRRIRGEKSEYVAK